MYYRIVLDPTDFGNRQDPLFHLGESYELAEGKGWFCMLSNCGEQKLYYKDKKRGDLYNEDVLDIFDTDDKLYEAIEKNKIELINNSWWELEFFKEGKNGNDYLDMFPPLDDNCIVDNPHIAIETFIYNMNNKEFVKELKERLDNE